MLSLTTCFVAITILWFFRQWYRFEVTKAKLKSIPTVGSSNFIGSFFSALRFAFDARGMMAEGYRKYPGSLFKVKLLTRDWMVLGSGHQIVEDIRKATVDQLSFSEAASESLGSKYLISRYYDGPNKIPYHFDVVRNSLTRSFSGRFTDIQDEIQASATDNFPQSEDWSEVPLFNSLAAIVLRTSHRLFVGLPICRNERYLRILKDSVPRRAMAANLIQLVPVVLKPIVGKMISPFSRPIEELDQLIGPMIRERLQQEETLGPTWQDRPKDLISWLLDIAPEEKRNVGDILFRLLSLNFVSVHTSATVLTNAMFDLAENLHYLTPLREEVEEMVGSYGWTKEAMNRMRKLDSFLKESGRLRGIGSTSMSRKVLKDVSLSEGTVLPAGCLVSVVAGGMHYDPELYNNPQKFDGFRFLNLRQTEEGGELKYQMVSLDHKYLLFGHGRSACPGRFFAVNEMKAIFAHIILNYDIKFPDGVTSHPEGRWFATSYTPSPSARLMIRKRR